MSKGDGCEGKVESLLGLIFEIVNSVSQGNFSFVRKKQGSTQGISETSGCSNYEETKQRHEPTLGVLLIEVSFEGKYPRLCFMEITVQLENNVQSP